MKLHDIAAEETVITSMLSSEDAAIDCLAELEEFHFTDSLRRDIFAAIAELMASKRKAVVPSIVERLQIRNPNLDSSIYEIVSAYCAGYVPSWELPKAIERLKTKYSHRQFVMLYKHALLDIESEPENADRAIESLQAALLDLQLPKSAKKLISIADAMPEVLEQIQAVYTGEVSPGVTTGFQSLDNICRYYPGDMIVIAARPSMGKTAFVLSTAASVALAGHDVAVFSLEMNRAALIQRLLGGAAKVAAADMRIGNLSEQDLERIEAAATELNKLGIYIDDTPYTTVQEIQNKARKLKLQKGLGLVIIDYIQLLNRNASRQGRESGRVEEVTEISRHIKLMAGELGVPVVALSQLSRACEARQDKRPMLSDLRESGAIEQDADIVTFIYRDEYYNPESDRRGEAEIIVRKNRNGRIGTADLLFHNATFTERTYGSSNQNFGSRNESNKRTHWTDRED